MNKMFTAYHAPPFFDSLNRVCVFVKELIGQLINEMHFSRFSYVLQR